MAKRTVTSGVRTGRWAGKGPAAKAQMPKGKVYFEVPATAPVKSRAPRRTAEQKAIAVVHAARDRLRRAADKCAAAETDYAAAVERLIAILQRDHA